MYELHRLRWNSFQQLCQTIFREVLGKTVELVLDPNDAGKDGSFAGTCASSKLMCTAGSSSRAGDSPNGRRQVQPGWVVQLAS